MVGDIVYNLIDFAEENWSPFLQRCEEREMDREEVERLIEILRAKTFAESNRKDSSSMEE
jgi:hypothetical protein